MIPDTVKIGLYELHQSSFSKILNLYREYLNMDNSELKVQVKNYTGQYFFDAQSYWIEYYK